MNIKTVAAALAVGAAVATPQIATAGGELQAYERPYTSYAATSYSHHGAYAPPPPAPYYARPASMYYGGYGCSPCATMPYGYSYGRPGGILGSDVFTAGLLGLGIGYLLFH